MNLPVRSRPFRAGILAVALLWAAVGAVAHADTKGDLQHARQRLRELRSAISDKEADVDALQAGLNALAGRIERAESELERTRADLLATQRRIAEAQEQLEARRDELGERAAEAYMNGPAFQFEFLLGASSLADLSDRIEFLGAIGERDAELASQIQNLTNELLIDRANLVALVAKHRSTVEALERDRDDLMARLADQQARYDDLERLLAKAAHLIGRLEKRLAAELAPPSSGGDGIPGPLYACPVSGPHAYGDTFGDWHSHPGWEHVHQGNDIVAAYGTPIVAPFDGWAVSGSDENAGIYVTLHGSQGFVQMLHMSGLGTLGQVETGDVVGYIGTSGNASGPHTHFEWHPGNGAAADPYPNLNEVC